MTCARTVSLLDRVVLSAIMTHRPQEQLTGEVTRESIEALIPLSSEALEPDANAKCKVRYDADRAFLVDRLSTAFDGCERTFLQVQSTVDKAWPAVSNAGLSSLRSLARLPCVTQDQVRQCLEGEFFGLSDHCKNKQKSSLDRVVSCLFYAPIGGQSPKTIPGQFILDVLNALRDGDVDDESLAEDFAAHQVDTRRAVSSFLFYVYLFAGLASLIVSLRVWDAYVLGSATVPTSNWMNYCKSGPTSECHFETRTFANIADREDALRFLRVELPTILWSNANGGPASSVPFGAAWFIGALSIRVAPTVGTTAAYSCSQLNLSKTYALAVTSQIYDCSGMSYATVPFSLTAAEALAALANFTIGSPFQDVTVIAAYALFMPSNGYTVFHEAALTFLQTGSVVSRARQYVSSPIMESAISVAFILHIVFALCEELLLAISKLRGLPVRVSLMQYVPKCIAFVAIWYSKIAVSSSDNVPDWLQTAGFALNVDSRVYGDQRAQYGFGVWALAIMCNACTYLKNFESVDLVVQLVSKSVAPVLSVTLVFMFNFITLVLIAMFLFGVNQIEFSTFVFAIRNTFPFLFGAGDPNVFTTEYSGLGYYYFAVFSIFISFIVMNVFTGILMAPLGGLASSASHLCYNALLTFTLRQKDVSNSQRRLLKLAYNVLPTLNLAKDALPFPDFNWSVVYNLLFLHTKPSDRVAAARKIYEMGDQGGVDSWRKESRLLRALEKKRKAFGISETSLALCLVVMAYESRLNFFRDARLLRLILFHDAANMLQNQAFSAEETEAEVDDDDDDEKVDTSHDSNSIAVIETEMSTTNEYSSMRSLINTATQSSAEVKYGFVEHIHEQLFSGGIISAPTVTFLIFLLEITLIVGYYLYIFIVVTSAAHETAFFTEDMHSGLRDGEYLQNCNDPQCASATTSPSTFMSNSQFSDVQAFLTRLLIPNLFPSPDDIPYDPSASVFIEGTTPVRWSPVPRLRSLTIRQLRGQAMPCKPFPSISPNTTENFARQTEMNSFPCFSDDEWASGPLPRPADSLLDPQAYVMMDPYCPNEVNERPIKGYQYSFPCKGFFATISNASQLAYAASTWLNDPSVKFISIGLVFQHSQSPGGAGQQLEAWYNLYAQLGMGGGQGEFWVSVTQKNSPLMEEISRNSFFFLCSNVALLLVMLAVQCLLRCSARGKYIRFSLYAEIAHSFPLMTTWMFAVCCVVFLLRWPSVKWANVTASCLIALYFNVKVITMIVLPLAGVLSRRGTTIPRMAVLVAKRFFIVAPFIAIFWVAFALAGNVIWGANVIGYATISKSFFTVSRGFLNAWDFGSIEAVFPGLAMLVTAVFFVVVLVVLLPTLLSLIVQSAEDANDELSITNAVCGLADETDSLVMFGPLARILLSVWCLAKLSAVAPTGDNEEPVVTAPHPVAFTRIGRMAMMPLLKLCLRLIGRSAMVLHEDENQFSSKKSNLLGPGADAERLYFDESWRMPTAIECLLPHIGPIQIAQLRDMLHYDDLRLSMKYTAVAFLLMQFKHFKRRNGEVVTDDAAKERKQCAIYAAVEIGSNRRGDTASLVAQISRATRIYSPVESSGS